MEREMYAGMPEGTRQRIIIFFKPSVMGSVKTRIARKYGARFACDLYTAMLEDLSRNLQPLHGQLAWYCAEAVNAGLEHIQGERSYIQRGADLGSRMYRALFDEFQTGAEKAILIGSDIPHIDYMTVAEYLKKLDAYDAVIGPSEDGGYYLIGFRRDTLKKAVFSDITWSTAGVYRETLEKIRTCRLKLYVGPAMRDIDTFEDLGEVLRTEQNRIPGVSRVFENYRRKHDSL